MLTKTQEQKPVCKLKPRWWIKTGKILCYLNAIGLSLGLVVLSPFTIQLTALSHIYFVAKKGKNTAGQK